MVLDGVGGLIHAEVLNLIRHADLLLKGCSAVWLMPLKISFSFVRTEGDLRHVEMKDRESSCKVRIVQNVVFF